MITAYILSNNNNNNGCYESFIAATSTAVHDKNAPIPSTTNVPGSIGGGIIDIDSKLCIIPYYNIQQLL